MANVERFFVGPQIAMSSTKSEKSGGGAPTLAMAIAGGLVFTNGVISNHPETGAFVAGDIRVQTRQVLENFEAGSRTGRYQLRECRDGPLVSQGHGGLAGLS